MRTLTGVTGAALLAAGTAVSADSAVPTAKSTGDRSESQVWTEDHPQAYSPERSGEVTAPKPQPYARKPAPNTEKSYTTPDREVEGDVKTSGDRGEAHVYDTPEEKS